MRTITRATAAMALAFAPGAVTGALAQERPATPAPPAAESPSAQSSSMAFLEAQKEMELRAAELSTMEVRNGTGEQLGDVSDIVVDSNGKVVAVLVATGGFLGIGEKLVGVPFDSMKVGTDSDGKRYMALDASRESLEAAPGYVIMEGPKPSEPASGTAPMSK